MSSQLPSRLLPLFESLRVPAHLFPYSARKAARDALQPLELVPFSPAVAPSVFHFNAFAHTALGDAVIQRAITQQVALFCARRTATTEEQEENPFRYNYSHNNVRQLTACFHNALSVRFVAESLPFEQILSSHHNNNDKNNSSSSSLFKILSASNAPSRGPSMADRLGTSFHMSQHTFAQNDLALRLSHFLGALEIYCGREVAVAAARRAFFDLDGERGNLPHDAVQVLAKLCKSYPVASVARSVLAAEGFVLRFYSRSFPFHENIESENNMRYQQQQHEEQEEEGQNQAKAADTAAAPHVAKEESSSSEVAAHTVPTAVATATATSSSSSSSSPVPPSSHALGPGRVDLVSKWRRSVAKSVSAATSDESSSTSTSTSTSASSDFFGSDSWRSKGSNLAAMFSSSSLSSSFSAAAGMPAPIRAQYASNTLHQKPVRDPSFFSAEQNVGKDGLAVTPPQQQGQGQLNTFAGSSSKSVIENLMHPHGRLFEVVMVRDPLVSSSSMRREAYVSSASAAIGGDSEDNAGRKFTNLSKASLLMEDDGSLASGGGENGGGGGGGGEGAATVGPRVLSRGVATSYGEARRNASINVLDRIVRDLSTM